MWMDWKLHSLNILNFINIVVKIHPFLRASLHSSCQYHLWHPVRRSEYNETLSYVYIFLRECHLSVFSGYILAARVCIYSFYCPSSFLRSMYFDHTLAAQSSIASEMVPQDPTAARVKWRFLRVFTCHCVFSQPSGQNGGVLTFPVVPDCVKGNSRRVTE